MRKFETFTSSAMPFPRKDVDTDMIIPAQYLTSISREGYGENLFRRLRDEDPAFPMNQPAYAESEILIAGSNFGCGSSREHAVWALLGAGFRAVIAPSFADIFSSNSGKNGLVLVQLEEAIVTELLRVSANGTCELTIDLENQKVRQVGGAEHSFAYDPFRKHCLLHGLDDIDYILSKRDRIDRFKEEREKHLYLGL